MTNPKKPTCDNCGSQFEIKKVHRKFAGKHNNQPVWAHYIKCPNCGARFVTHYETNEIAALTREQQRIRSKYKQLCSYQSSGKTLTEAEAERIGAETDDLAARWNRNQAALSRAQAEIKAWAAEQEQQGQQEQQCVMNTEEQNTKKQTPEDPQQQ